MVDFTKAIKQNPDDAKAYCNRGVAYGKKGEFDYAIEDYIKAIELKPDYADAYYNRGIAWLHLGEWENAKSDLTTAKEKGANIAIKFRVEYESLPGFEQKHDVQLPADIAEMLSQNPVNPEIL